LRRKPINGGCGATNGKPTGVTQPRWLPTIAPMDRFPRHRTQAPSSRHRGFTLIELMIAVVVVALLAAVALPSFLDQIRKSRRSEAFTAISAVQQAQERWRGNNPTFNDDLSEIGITSATTGPGGYYTLAITTPTGSERTEYIVTAVAVSGTSQVKDGDCARLGVRVAGGQISYASCASCTIASATFAASDACWNR
jgi:type IV pilus assembly protein PilE